MEKTRKRKLGAKRILFLSTLTLIIILLLLFLGLYFYARSSINFEMDESLFKAGSNPTVTRLYYKGSDGTQNIYAELSAVSDKKLKCSLDEIGENLKSAFIAAEDRRFYEHNGVDFKRTAFAFLNYFLHIKPKFGGSTITQQVVKNISGDNDQTVIRKLSEILRAREFEKNHTKDEILELYLNIVPMGDRISGVGLASEHYFGRSPSELSLSEAATLVGITNAPRKYDPIKHPEECFDKRNRVLYAMYDAGKITKDEYEIAVLEPLTVLLHDNKNENVDSWFAETVCDDVVSGLVIEKGMNKNAARMLVMSGGLTIHTTVDPKIQAFLEEYFANNDNFPDAVNDGLNYSMVICDTDNSDLLAIVGAIGKKTANRIMNYATVNVIPGSSLKPLALYAPLIDQGKINWATVFDDVPVYFNRDKDENYLPYPKNSPSVYDGLTTVSDALRRSKNTIAVRLYNILGAEAIYKSLYNDFKFDSLVKSEKTKNGEKITDMAISPLALGQLTSGVPLRKLTESYTVFQGDGVYQYGRSFTAVYDSEGKLLLDNSRSAREVFSSSTARIMNQLLARVTESGTASAITLDQMVDTAGKTGTSGNDKDRLFIGYTPYYTAGIWCGYPNRKKSIGTQEISHIEIWDDIMKSIHESILEKNENVKRFNTEGLEYLPYCKDSGKLFSDKCKLDLRGERMEYGYFTSDNKPCEICDRHTLCFVDSRSGKLAEKGSSIFDIRLAAMLDVGDRQFPCEISVTDEAYVVSRDSSISGATAREFAFLPDLLFDKKHALRGK